MLTDEFEVPRLHTNKTFSRYWVLNPKYQDHQPNQLTTEPLRAYHSTSTSSQHFNFTHRKKFNLTTLQNLPMQCNSQAFNKRHPAVKKIRPIILYNATTGKFQVFYGTINTYMYTFINITRTALITVKSKIITWQTWYIFSELWTVKWI